jgi:hypothetical protein
MLGFIFADMNATVSLFRWYEMNYEINGCIMYYYWMFWFADIIKLFTSEWPVSMWEIHQSTIA